MLKFRAGAARLMLWERGVALIPAGYRAKGYRQSLHAAPIVSNCVNRVPSFRRFLAQAAQVAHNFAALEERDLDFFRKILGDSGVVTDVDDLETFNVDWMVRLNHTFSVLCMRSYVLKQIIGPAQVQRTRYSGTAP